MLLGLVAIGGANAVVPEMHRYVVEVERWMSDGEFAALFAIANAAPGPNVLIVTLVGWHVAGHRRRARHDGRDDRADGPHRLRRLPSLEPDEERALARRPCRTGLSAVTVGLVAATAWILTLTTATNMRLAAVAVATAAVSYLTKVNPLWCFAVAAALGAAGLL